MSAVFYWNATVMVVLVQSQGSATSQGHVDDLTGGILVHIGFVPNSLTKRCWCACVRVCERASVSVPVPMCVRVYIANRAGLETDESNRCQICGVGPFSGRREGRGGSPISHLAVMIRGRAAEGLMYAVRPKECEHGCA